MEPTMNSSELADFRDYFHSDSLHMTSPQGQGRANIELQRSSRAIHAEFSNLIANFARSIASRMTELEPGWRNSSGDPNVLFDRVISEIGTALAPGYLRILEAPARALVLTRVNPASVERELIKISAKNRHISNATRQVHEWLSFRKFGGRSEAK
jgi:hypothetical protein